jgi:cytochrome b6-f complex iron-sulfur subunit
MDSTSRRDFLRKFSIISAITAGTLAAVSLLRQFVPRLTQHKKRFRIGKGDQYPVNSFTYVEDRQLFVYRDHEGIRAVSAVCTHLGCIIEHNDEGFQCPCHGSCFNDEGKVLSGAATKDLPWFSLQKDVDGRIIVDLSRPVEPGAKLRL